MQKTKSYNYKEFHWYSPKARCLFLLLHRVLILSWNHSHHLLLDVSNLRVNLTNDIINRSLDKFNYIYVLERMYLTWLFL